MGHGRNHQLTEPVNTPDPPVALPIEFPGASGSHHERLEEGMISNVAEPLEAKTGCQIPELSQQLEKDLVQVFKLLSDETRLRVLMYLTREGELHVTALCDKLNQSQPAVSHHLALLRVAGLIEARRDGKHNYYSVKTSHFQRLMNEIFTNLVRGETDEVRFDDFLLSYSPDYMR